MSHHPQPAAPSAALAPRAARPIDIALLASVFVVAACGLLYELAAGALASSVLGESVLEFFSRADTAMYMAKEGGRNQVVVEEPIAKGDSQMSDLSIPSSHAFL